MTPRSGPGPETGFAKSSDVAGLGFDEAADDIQQCGLATAGRTKHGEELARLDLDVDVAQCLRPARRPVEPVTHPIQTHRDFVGSRRDHLKRCALSSNNRHPVALLKSLHNLGSMVQMARLPAAAFTFLQDQAHGSGSQAMFPVGSIM